jgi:hypothetical protein
MNVWPELENAEAYGETYGQNKYLSFSTDEQKIEYIWKEEIDI